MAYLVAVSSWNTTLFDLNLPFSSAAVTTSTPASALSSFSGTLVINGASYVQNAQTASIVKEVDSNWAVGNQAQVLGSGLVVGANGTVSGGLVKGIALTLADQFNFGISGFNIGGSLLGNAQNTASNADDQVVFSQIMRGNDLVFLSGSADVIDTGNGIDVIYAGLGADSISSGTFGDIVSGEGGHDTIDGGSGADILFGGAGNDSLLGGMQGDTIMGGAGDDVLVGGGGFDKFVFHTGGGNDVVNDFGAGDRLLIRDAGVVFSDLTVTQQGLDTLVSFTNTTILLLNTSASLITPGRVVLNGNAEINTSVATTMNGWDYFV